MQPESVEDIAPDHFRYHTVVLGPGSKSIGQTIDELGLSSMDINVLALRRGNIRGDEPDITIKLREGDALLLEGGTEQLQHAEEILLSGH